MGPFRGSLRFIPEGGALVEVTCRTIQGRLLMRPSPLLNEIILGVLGRAQSRYPVEIVGYVFASSHYHLLLRVDQADRLSEFMGYFGGNLAREIARLTGWKDKVWSRRYKSILITDEESAQVERLAYIVSNTVKENLVARVEDWPGVHCARPLLTGEEVQGTWFNQRLEYNARLQGKEPGTREFASPEKVTLSQLPCWRHLASEAYHARIVDLVRRTEETAAVARQESGIEPLGADGVRSQNPETRPMRLKKSPAPFVHAATRSARKAIWEAYAFYESVASVKHGAPGGGSLRGPGPPSIKDGAAKPTETSFYSHSIKALLQRTGAW